MKPGHILSATCRELAATAIRLYICSILCKSQTVECQKRRMHPCISFFSNVQGDFGSEDFASGSFDFGSQDFGSQDFGSQDFGSRDFPSDFGPGPLYGMSASPFLRRVDPQEIGNQGETPIGRWGSRKPSETPPAPRTPVRNGKLVDSKNTKVETVRHCQLSQHSKETRTGPQSSAQAKHSSSWPGHNSQEPA